MVLCDDQGGEAEEGPGHQQAGRDDDEERPAGNTGISYIEAEEGPGHQQASRDDDEERPAGNIIHIYSS